MTQNVTVLPDRSMMLCILAAVKLHSQPGAGQQPQVEAEQAA